MAALQIEAPAERAAYLDQACPGTAVLRQRVEGLLRGFDQAGSFLQQPAASCNSRQLLATAGSFLQQPAAGTAASVSPCSASTLDRGAAEIPGTVIGP